MLRTCKPYRVKVETDALGAGSATLEVANGKLLAVHYVKSAGALAFADGVSATLKETQNGVDIQTLLAIPAGSMNSSSTAPFRPLNPSHTTAGVAIADAYQPPIISDGKITIAVADGGASNEGTFIVVVGE